MALCSGALAQTASPTPYRVDAGSVSWSVEAKEGAITATPGQRAVLTVRGEVRKGWHVYALDQDEEGPTPLRVSLDSDELASPDGKLSASKPHIVHDAAFNLETPYYSEPFLVEFPVRFRSNLASGRSVLPISLRFQACSGQICEPPKTIHLTATVNILKAG